jgi:phosphoribosylformimino-5-aminoimidazole carboxamide ribotide isomerase
MILYPTIAIRQGLCVSAVHEEEDDMPLPDDRLDPLEQALYFENLGIDWLHVLDLDGATQGRPANTAKVEQILRTCKANIQVGGGIRDMETVERWVKYDASRVLLGTAALQNPDFVKEACRAFPGKIGVSIDARDGFVVRSGWSLKTHLRALDVALMYEDCGAAAIVHSDVNPAGALAGVNVEAIADLAFSLTTPVIASGGVTSLSELRDLKAEEDAGIAGVIVGKALYDGRIDLQAALKLLKTAPSSKGDRL